MKRVRIRAVFTAMLFIFTSKSISDLLATITEGEKYVELD